MPAPTLNVYQDNHLRVTFDHHAATFYGPMVEASRAHVVMLTEQGLLTPDRGAQLLTGLERMREDDPGALVFDGSVEDIYYTVEARLAQVCGIPTSQLDLQMARSRNDLDQGIFRMILRRQLMAVQTEVLRAADALTRAADEYADVVIIGYTHRRPAQPTTIGHALAGYAEALTGQARAYRDLLAEVNVSPLGSCAFAGTDLPISSPRLAELLGFDGVVLNSYEAVAGADHLVRVGTLNAQALATGARLARTLMDWLTWRWVSTPADFTQGSSIMPQKRNPVVLEHLVSMAGATAADAASVLNNVGAAWWEDSNNATTDVQVRLWDSNDRAERFFRMVAGFIEAVEPLEPPSDAEIVATGATTTSAADALAASGVPFRAAHSVVGRLVRAGDPAGWTPEQVRAAATDVGIDPLPDAAVYGLIEAANQPSRVRDRVQPDGPGTGAVRAQVATLRAAADGYRQELDRLDEQVQRAGHELDRVVRERAGR